MRIQHNITALNAHRNLSNNNTAVGKNLEKLSSGYRINRAGDDAAGLAISEKMRAQITGLQTAQKNAEDGVSLVQTAEGALTEVQSMLNRMVELATQSANGTYSEKNREEMQKEVDALNAEIDRISNTANFNGTQLFGGNGAGKVKVYEADNVKIAGQTVAGTQQAGAAAKYETGDWAKNTGNDVNDAKITVKVDGPTGQHDVEIALTKDQAKMDAADLAKVLSENEDLQVYGIKVTTNGNKLVFTSDETGSGVDRVTEVTYNKTAAGQGGSLPKGTATVGKDEGKTYDLSGTMAAGDEITINGKTYTYDANATGADGKFKDVDTLKKALEADGITLEDQGTGNNGIVFKEKVDGNGGGKDGVKITLHVGESSADTNAIDVNIKNMSTKSLGIDKIDITDVAGAKAAIDVVNAAIDDVSSIRADLGALQNRLEHTINNLGVQTENISAAESRIRDVDMAKEMMHYTKNNILVQASQAMLAQANQVPQSVLQLLQ